MQNFERLKDEIFAKRWGVVHFDVRAFDRRKFEQTSHLLDSYVEQLGMHGIGKSWREVDALGARKIIQRILHRDLAYNSDLMLQTDAKTLADRVISLFSSRAEYYTNGNFDQDAIAVGPEIKRGPSWYPITKATFDTGIVFVDKSRIGLIWVEDED